MTEEDRAGHVPDQSDPAGEGEPHGYPPQTPPVQAPPASTAPAAPYGAPQPGPAVPHPPPPYGSPGPVPAPYPLHPYAPVPPQGAPYAVPMRPDEERNWALFGHLSALLGGFVGLPFLGPLVIMLMIRDRSAFARAHAVESLNFQLSLLIYTTLAVLAGVAVSLLTFGAGLLLVVPLMVVVPILVMVFIVLAAMAAGRGEGYRYPLTIRMVR